MSPHFKSARCSGMLNKNKSKHGDNCLCFWAIRNPGIFPMRMERIDGGFLHLQDVLCRSFSYCRPLPSLPKVVPHGSTGRGYMPQKPPPLQELWTSEAQEIVRTMFQSDFAELGYSQDRLPGWRRKRFWKFLVLYLPCIDPKKGGHATANISFPISSFHAPCTFPYNSYVYSVDILHLSYMFSPNNSNISDARIQYNNVIQCILYSLYSCFESHFQSSGVPIILGKNEGSGMFSQSKIQLSQGHGPQESVKMTRGTSMR